MSGIYVGLDQSTEQTGYVIIGGELVLDIGSWVTPKGLGVFESQMWQTDQLHDYLVHWQYAFEGERIRAVGLEGSFLQTVRDSQGRKRNNVNVLQRLDELRGSMMRDIHRLGLRPHIVPVNQVTNFIRMPMNTIRLAKKQGALLTARYLLQASGSHSELAEAMREASDAVNNWKPNVEGQPKTGETLLKHLDKYLEPHGCTTDSADALIIAHCTRAAF